MEEIKEDTDAYSSMGEMSTCCPKLKAREKAHLWLYLALFVPIWNGWAYELAKIFEVSVAGFAVWLMKSFSSL